MLNDNKNVKLKCAFECQSTVTVHKPAGQGSKRYHITKDAYGNVIKVTEEPLIFGIF